MEEKETPEERMHRLLGKALTPLTLVYCKKETDVVQECIRNTAISETQGCIDAYNNMKDCFNWLLGEADKRCPQQFYELYQCLDRSNGNMHECKANFDIFLNCWNHSL